MEGDEDVEEGGASMDLSAAGIVCKKKYEETESCGSAADFLSGVAINAGKSDEIEISNEEGAGGEEGLKGGGGDLFDSKSDDNGNTSLEYPTCPWQAL